MNRSHAWQQHGTMSLWSYRDNLRNFPGWHLGADAAGGVSLLALLDALGIDGAGATRTLQITAPSAAQLAVPNNRDAQWEAPTTWRLTFDDGVPFWQWQVEERRVSLRLGSEAMADLRHGVLDIAAGRGDHSVGHGAQALWFWWWPHR
ncbi:hypothetical protein KQ945_05925 [Bacillus subtilis subsp. subtilis]|nr:hypothetical protein [Bacillus subtilis subsp. subtilis]